MAAYERPQRPPGASGIIKIDKKLGRWEGIPIALINDRRLQLDTLGLAVWLAACPENWELRVWALPRLLASTGKSCKPLGRERTRRMLRELQQTGYLKRTRSRNAQGRWQWPSLFSAGGLTTDGAAVDGPAVGGSAVDGKPVVLSQTPLIPDRLIKTGFKSRAERRKADETRLAGLRKIRNCGPPRLAGDLAQNLLQKLTKVEEPSSTES